MKNSTFNQTILPIKKQVNENEDEQRRGPIVKKR